MGDMSWSSEKGLDLSSICAALGWLLADLPRGGLQHDFCVLHRRDEKRVWSKLPGKRMPEAAALRGAYLPVREAGGFNRSSSLDVSGCSTSVPALPPLCNE